MQTVLGSIPTLRVRFSKIDCEIIRSTPKWQMSIGHAEKKQKSTIA